MYAVHRQEQVLPHTFAQCSIPTRPSTSQYYCNTLQVLRILESHRIGNVAPKDRKPDSAFIVDLFGNEPSRSSQLTVINPKPYRWLPTTRIYNHFLVTKAHLAALKPRHPPSPPTLLPRTISFSSAIICLFPTSTLPPSCSQLQVKLLLLLLLPPYPYHLRRRHSRAHSALSRRSESQGTLFNLKI